MTLPPLSSYRNERDNLAGPEKGRTGNSGPAFSSNGHPLTRSQIKAMRFIQGFIYAKGWSPTYRTIGDGLGLKSTSGVHRLIKALVERGYISQDWVAYDYCEITILRTVPIPRIGKVPLQFIGLEEITWTI